VRNLPTDLQHKFFDTFGVPANKFLDSTVTMATGKFCFHLLRFEDWLVLNSDYKREGPESISSAVKRVYGEKAVALLKKIFDWEARG